MTGLATLFMVWGMVFYSVGRERLLEHKQAGWGLILFGLAVGVIGLFAKETAALFPGYLLVIELLVYRFSMPTSMQKHGLQGAYILAIGLPLTWALTTHLFSPNWIEIAYANRSFTLEERLLTEGRVLWDYLYLTWLPNIQSMGLYHDGYRISRSLFEPVTFIAAVSHGALLGAAFMLRKQWPLFLFATAWFYVGHSAESTVLPLELKYEHRNYLPMLGMLLLLTYSVFTVSARLKNTQKIRSIVLTAIVLTFSGSAFVRISQFGDFWGFAGMEAEHYPESSRANQNAAISIIKLMMQIRQSTPELIAQATKYLHRSARANPQSSAPLFTAVLILPEFTHQPPATESVEELANRLRHALPDANINTYFSALLRQAEEGKLQLNPTQVHILFDHAEANPHIRRSTKADIIAIRAAYAQSVEHDNNKARSIIDRALATDSSISSIYVPAVWIYQEAGMWQDAANLLDKLKKLDSYGIESHSITWLSQRQHDK
jgi:protein O-mannosyl-transferase